MENKKQFMMIMWVVVALYVVSPIDLLPGPIDDVILSIVATVVQVQSLIAQKHQTTESVIDGIDEL